MGEEEDEDGELFYEIKWQGYPSSKNTLEPITDALRGTNAFKAYVQGRRCMIRQLICSPSPIRRYGWIRVRVCSVRRLRRRWAVHRHSLM